MKRFILIAAALSALVAASVAVAHLKAGDVSAVSATLSAPTTANVLTRTVTCDGQTIEVTTGRYTGTATSTTADLNGTGRAVREEHLQHDDQARLGQRLAEAARRRTAARRRASRRSTSTASSTAGCAARADHRRRPALRQPGGSFTKTGGLTDGTLGTGTGANAAVIAKRVSCKEESRRGPACACRARLGRVGHAIGDHREADGRLREPDLHGQER